MSSRKQPRRLARELALLSLSQLKVSPEKIEQVELSQLVLATIRTLKAEVNDILETAGAEVQRSYDRLLSSEIRSANIQSAKTMLTEALQLAETAINRLGTAVEIPELIEMSKQHEVREYALELIGTVKRRRQEIDDKLTAGLVDWQLSRITQIDRQILRIAVAEIMFLEIPHKVAINEAIELAKHYSDDEGHRFVNGVLRRVTDQLKETVNT